MAFTINVNAQTHSVDVDDDTPLLWVLRDVLGVTGTKFGCGAALCGACTVHIDGVATRSCVTTIDSVGGSAITIEAIGETPAGKAVQEAWLDLEVVQCGYCQSGQVMSAAALLAENPGPSDVGHRSRDRKRDLRGNRQARAEAADRCGPAEIGLGSGARAQRIHKLGSREKSGTEDWS
jgi:isoquinoline 1-oxidoreductase subunit alpha